MCGNHTHQIQTVVSSEKKDKEEDEGRGNLNVSIKF